MEKYSGSLIQICKNWFKDNYPFDPTIYPDTEEGEKEYNDAIDKIISSVSYEDAKKCWEESSLHEAGDWIIDDIYAKLKNIAENLL